MSLTLRPYWFDQEPVTSIGLAAENDLPPDQCEVAVIGGGVAGLATALHLAARGVDTLLLEAARVGEGATGRSDGQVLLATGEHPSRLVGQLGPERADLLFKCLKENIDLVATLPVALSGWRQEGGWRLAESTSEASELAASADLPGVNGEFFGAAETARRIPALTGFHGGLFQPEEGVVDPLGLAYALAHKAADHGACLHQHTPVLAISGGAGDFKLTWTRQGEKGRTRAAIVVLAASCASRHLDSSGYLERVLCPMRAQALATPPLPTEIIDGLPESPISCHFCYEYLRRHGNRLVVGGMRWSVPGEEVGNEDTTRINEDIHRNLSRWLKQHAPALKGLARLNAWTGILCGTPDGLPLCGMIPGKSGLFVLAGFNGYGLGLAPVIADTIACQAMHGKADSPWETLYRPDRFA